MGGDGYDQGGRGQPTVGAWGIPERPGRSDESGGRWSREKRSLRLASEVPGQMAETSPSGWARIKHPDFVIPKRRPTLDSGSCSDGRFVPILFMNV
jgi:hypothetical protein